MMQLIEVCLLLFFVPIDNGKSPFISIQEAAEWLVQHTNFIRNHSFDTTRTIHDEGALLIIWLWTKWFKIYRFKKLWTTLITTPILFNIFNVEKPSPWFQDILSNDGIGKELDFYFMNVWIAARKRDIIFSFMHELTYENIW